MKQQSVVLKQWIKFGKVDSYMRDSAVVNIAWLHSYKKTYLKVFEDGNMKIICLLHDFGDFGRLGSVFSLFLF